MDGPSQPHRLVVAHVGHIGANRGSHTPQVPSSQLRGACHCQRASHPAAMPGEVAWDEERKKAKSSESTESGSTAQQLKCGNPTPPYGCGLGHFPSL